MAQMANKKSFIAVGTFEPTSDATTLYLDTGATGWTHFLIVDTVIPFQNPLARGLGLRYLDTELGIELNCFGTSAGSEYPDNCKAWEQHASVNNGVITSWSGIASQIGKFIAGRKYNWYCW